MQMFKCPECGAKEDFNLYRHEDTEWLECVECGGITEVTDDLRKAHGIPGHPLPSTEELLTKVTEIMETLAKIADQVLKNTESIKELQTILMRQQIKYGKSKSKL